MCMQVRSYYIRVIDCIIDWINTTQVIFLSQNAFADKVEYYNVVGVGVCVCIYIYKLIFMVLKDFKHLSAYISYIWCT